MQLYWLIDLDVNTLRDIKHTVFGYGRLAQLVRAIACHAIGRGFESLHSRHFSLLINIYIIKNVT